MHPFLSQPFRRAIICSIFSAESFFQAVLSILPAFTWMRVLCILLFLFYRRTYASIRACYSPPGVPFGPPLLFRKPAASFASREKPRRRGLRGQSYWTKGRTDWKSQTSAVVKHLRSVSYKIHGSVALYNLRFQHASIVTRKINGSANIGAIISCLKKCYI